MKQTLTGLIALGCFGVGAGAVAQTDANISSKPTTAGVRLTPQDIVATIKSQLPLALENDIVISHADVKSDVSIELTVGGVGPTRLQAGERFPLSDTTASSAAATAICRSNGIVTRFLTTQHVIYLNIPSAGNGPARYKISGETCGKKYPTPTKMATPMHELSMPAVVYNAGKQSPAEFSSCQDWKSRLALVKPNNGWLMSYKLSKLVKAEFETTQAYEMRKLSQQKAFVNLAVSIDPDGLIYNADSAILKVNLTDHATLRRDTLLDDSYTATNAFGVTMSVDRFQEKVISVKFRNALAVLPRNRYIQMSVNTAKAIKERGVIRVLGVVVEHNETFSQYRKPSLNDPRDVSAFNSEYLVEPYCVSVMVDGREIADWQEL